MKLEAKVKLAPEEGDPKLKGYASVVIDDCFIIHGIRIIEKEDGLIIAMPSRKNASGKFVDIAHPLNAETRKLFEDAIFEKYNEALIAE
jgi:stage V sporulation protein G